MKLALLFWFLITAAAEDIRSGKISNRLIAAGLISGLLCKLTEYQIWGVYYFLRNISVPVILLFLLFLMRVLGAGDIKLFSMIGSILTIQELFRCMVYGIALGGILSFFYLVADKYKWQRLRYAWSYLADSVKTKQIKPYVPPREAGELKMPFSIPILLGTILVLYIPVSG